ncbi:hypothetical protein LIER_21277 [Lithospermum erythrorhizon]|uniref:Retrotransposon Copia-like N-terminal domain-containing protein n=1 Tax=Lithospermum erythrorhizon TaxID=34254 RepID=A0AAV3QT52_LITER
MVNANEQVLHNQNRNQNQSQFENLQNNDVASAIKIDDPLFLHSSDYSSLVLVSDVLTQTNYVAWSRAMKVAMKARDKYGFLNREIETPSMEDVRFKQWNKVNSTLISWIMNALSKDISRGFVFMDDAKLLWEEIREQFGGSNGLRVFELRMSIYTIKQGDGEDRMMYFLMGVGDEYDAIKNQVLIIDFLPSIAKTYSMIVKVKRRKVVHSVVVDVTDNVVMQIKAYVKNKNQQGSSYGEYKTRNNNTGKPVFRRREDKSHLKCDFCDKTGHVKFGCFKLVGFLEWWTGVKNGGMNNRNRVSNVNTYECEIMNLPLDLVGEGSS